MQHINQTEEAVTTGLAGAVMKEIQHVADKFKDEDIEMLDTGVSSPYARLEKASVLQEARIFHDSVAVRENPRRCCTIIAQLLHLTNTGQFLTSNEATDVFFGVTKLFMSDDASLRRMVYLFIKEVAENCNPDDVIIVTSSLTKDMTCDVDLYRANSLRVLTRIIDGAMLGAIERYIKQAIVDSSGQVASSALVSALHLSRASTDNYSIVKRWISEVQEATSSCDQMVQFHAIQLLYRIKMSDRLGISKIVQKFSNCNVLKSPLALVCLVRYASKLLHDEVAVNVSILAGKGYQSTMTGLITRSCYQFLEASLRHPSEIVVFEAARSICFLPLSEPNDISPAISVLRLFLSSPKPSMRFAAVKVIATAAVVHPRPVSKCNDDLESLVLDANRSVATLAITTLLKTGPENSIDRLLKQISAFLSDIADEYKVTVVKCLQELCLIYPLKHRVLVGFMSNFLREEGGFEFKKTIVSSIIYLLRVVPETAETSLLHLCEFIEDCEFTMLSTQILHLLGDVGPKTLAPSRYIRFIYNRVILEKSEVRAAAVSALAKFAARVPSLRTSVTTLLRRSLDDEDDETRDRAAIAVEILDRDILSHPFVSPFNNAPNITEERRDIYKDEPRSDDLSVFLLLNDMPISFHKLKRSLEAYISISGAMASSEPMSFAVLPTLEDEYEDSQTNAENIDDTGNILTGSYTLTAGLPLNTNINDDGIDFTSAICNIPELTSLGRPFLSSSYIPLTESETEYVVTCTKHAYSNKMILLFYVRNTLEDQRLENVTVALEPDGEALYEVAGEIHAVSIPYDETGMCVVVLDKTTDGLSFFNNLPVSYAAVLKFSVYHIDPVSGGEEGELYEEEYKLEDINIVIADFIAKVSVPDFRETWEDMGTTNEVLEKYGMAFETLDNAVEKILELLGMQPCDGTGSVKNFTGSNNKTHMIHACGVLIDRKDVLVRIQITLTTGDNVFVVKIAARSDDVNISRLIANCIA